MVINKYAESKFSTNEIYSSEKALSDPEVSERFMKLAQQLKKVAPNSKDFLFFSCVMLHSAEASLIDQETGNSIVKNGKNITAKWEINDKGSWKWVCSDENIKPYKNNNGDIFPESELKKAYKNWIGRPLCKDHQSSSVDGIRGIIIDAYWDNKRKRVIGLCALDKINYPDLARKVETGYANNVSMGTAVGKSICYNCGNVAMTEAEYCPCVKNKNTYGEINIDLSPLELSIVVTGADPRAKLRNIVASLNDYTQKQTQKIAELKAAGCVTPAELERVEAKMEEIRIQLSSLTKIAALSTQDAEKLRHLTEALKNVDEENAVLIQAEIKDLLSGNLTPEDMAGMAQTATDAAPYGLAGSYDKDTSAAVTLTDPQQSGGSPWGPDSARLASENEVRKIYGKLEEMEKNINKLTQVFMEEHTMSEKELKSRAISRRAYWLGGGGVNEPTPGKPTYDKDPMGENVRNKEDKQMVGENMETGSDGLYPGDQKLKEMLSRAEMDERKMKRHALLRNADQAPTKLIPVYKDNQVTGYVDQTADDGEEQEQLYARDNTMQAKDECPMCHQKCSSVNETLRHMKQAHSTKLAYWLGGGGINEPTPGKEKYPKDPMGDNVRNKEDKQMVGEGMEMGSDGLYPGDLEAKKKVLRASKLRAKMIKARNEDGSINKGASKWVIFAGNEPILQATGTQAFGNELNNQWDFFASKEYGLAVMAHIRTNGFAKTAYSLTGNKKFAAGMPDVGVPEAPAAAPGMEMPGMGMEMPGMEAPKPPKAETVENVKGAVEEALKTVENTLGDLREALEEDGVLEGGKEELPPVEIGEEEKSPKVTEEPETPEAPAPEIAKASAQLTVKIADIYRRLDDNADELALLSQTFGKQLKAGSLTGATSELIRLASESLNEHKNLISEASYLMRQAKPKKGVNPFADKDDKESKKDDKKSDDEKKGDKTSGTDKDKSSKEDEKKSKDEKKSDDEKKGDKTSGTDKDKSSKEDEKKSKESKAEAMLASLLKSRADYRAKLAKAAEKALDNFEEDEPLSNDELGDDLMDMDMYDGIDGEEDLMSAEEDLMSAEDEINTDELESEFDAAIDASAGSNDINVRRAWREKVAAEYLQKLDSQTTVDSDVWPKAHPGGGTTIGDLDTKPSENLHHFETIEEQHDAIMKEVQSLPKVREAISHLSRLLKSGALTTNDLNNSEKLMAFAVDSSTATYWKKYFGMGDKQSKTYGAEMTKEYMKKKASDEREAFKLKMRRAYDIALEMSEKGLISESEIHKQADDISKFGEVEFEAFKRAIERASGVKIARASYNEFPMSGVRESGISTDGIGDGSIATQLERMW